MFNSQHLQQTYYNISDNVATLMNNDRYQEALQILPNLIKNEKGLKKVFPMIDKVTCQLETGHEEAVVTAMEVVSLLESEPTANEMNSIKDKVFDKLIILCKNLFESNYTSSSLSLLCCLTTLTKDFYKDQTQLRKFELIGISIKNLAVEMKKENAKEQIKQCYNLFDEIFDQMKVVSNVDLKFKCKLIVRFLKAYGRSCNLAEDNSKSEIVHNNAIVLMKTVFGSEAKKYCLLGDCFNNLGSSYVNSNQLHKAKISFQNALDIYKQAIDFDNENVKQKHISLSSSNIQIIQNKLRI